MRGRAHGHRTAKQSARYTEYLLLDNRRQHALLYRKGDDGDWLDFAIAAEADIPLESIGLRLSLASLYEGVTFDTE